MPTELDSVYLNFNMLASITINRNKAYKNKVL
jgi:hypothetical protein